MITIKCPACGKSFNDCMGENATANERGYMINYDRYYTCVHCGKIIDIKEDKIVEYYSIKDIKGENEE